MSLLAFALAAATPCPLVPGELGTSEALTLAVAAARCLAGADRGAVLDRLPPGAGPLSNALARATDEQLALLPSDVPADAVVSRLAVAGVEVNPYLRGTGGLPSSPLAWTMRAVQPAVVRIVVGQHAGSGVNLDPAGRILTAAHVVDDRAQAPYVEFPDGTGFMARVVAFDAFRDLALLALEGGLALPVARVAPAPPELRDPVVIIGNPGRGATPPFQVTWGHILWMRAQRDGDQASGAVAHDADTNWGHSGSPLFDAAGRIVALHNSYEVVTGTRHAVSWEAIRAFLDLNPG